MTPGRHFFDVAFNFGLPRIPYLLDIALGRSFKVIAESRGAYWNESTCSKGVLVKFSFRRTVILFWLNSLKEK